MRISDCPCILIYRKLNSGLIITSRIEGCALETSIFRSSLSLVETQLYTVPQSLHINPLSMYCTVLYAKRFVFMSQKISNESQSSIAYCIQFFLLKPLEERGVNEAWREKGVCKQGGLFPCLGLKGNILTTNH